MAYPLELTENFDWAEAEITIHRTIDNTIPEHLFPVIMNTAIGMERIRKILGLPVSISSWYRCPELNVLVGSGDYSDHPKGKAVDWICPRYGSPIIVAKKLIRHRRFIKFDQLILEHNWIHTSFPHGSTCTYRDEVLSLLKIPDPKTGRNYADGLTDASGISHYV